MWVVCCGLLWFVVVCCGLLWFVVVCCGLLVFFGDNIYMVDCVGVQLVKWCMCAHSLGELKCVEA